MNETGPRNREQAIPSMSAEDSLATAISPAIDRSAPLPGREGLGVGRTTDRNREQAIPSMSVDESLATDIVLRARNDMPLVADTVRLVTQQSLPSRIIAFDNGSTDGTRELLSAASAKVIDVAAGEYVPGKVLNQGASAARSEIVVYLNSDCTPVDTQWLAALIAPFKDPQVGAVFGRQIPRPDCRPMFAADTESTFGDGSRQKYWRHCFSMASSAIRRSVWEQLPFNETIGYSEDIEWSWRIRNAGFTIQYAAESVVMHSHNYTWRQYYRRQFGEGKAEAEIFEWDRWQRSWVRYSLLPYCRQVLGDLRRGLRAATSPHVTPAVRKAELHDALASPYLRSAQLLGRRAGFLAGKPHSPRATPERKARPSHSGHPPQISAHAVGPDE